MGRIDEGCNAPLLLVHLIRTIWEIKNCKNVQPYYPQFVHYQLHNRFQEHTQHDACEAFTEIMSIISDNGTKTESVQVNCFNGSLGYTNTCFRCGTSETISGDLFYFIPVEIPKSGKSVCAIDECISEFLKKETLAGENKVFCSRCKQSQNHARQCVIETLPET